MRFSPDFTRTAPDKGPYCACCQKPIKNKNRSVKVTVNWETWEYIVGHSDVEGWSNHATDKTYFGRVCYRKL